MTPIETSDRDVLQDHVLETQLGEIRYSEKDVIVFSEGLMGFEHLRRYVIFENEDYSPFRWLVSLQEPQMIFPVLDPLLIDPAYDPQISTADGWDKFYAIVTMSKNIESMTANLRAPIIVSHQNRLGRQVILADTNYTIRQKILINSEAGD